MIINVFLDVNPVKKVMRGLIRPIECLNLALSRHQHQRKILLRMFYRSIAQMLRKGTSFICLVCLETGRRLIKAIIDGNDDRAFAYYLTCQDGDLLNILRLKLEILRGR